MIAKAFTVQNFSNISNFFYNSPTAVFPNKPQHKQTYTGINATPGTVKRNKCRTAAFHEVACTCEGTTGEMK
jgi:hypothetical protein